MDSKLIGCFALSQLFLLSIGHCQTLKSDIAYVENGHERQVLDIYSPANVSDKKLPVMFWIHGGE